MLLTKSPRGRTRYQMEKKTLNELNRLISTVAWEPRTLREYNFSAMSRYMLFILVVASIAPVSAEPTNTVPPKTVAQAENAIPTSVGTPKPSVVPTAGTWRYKETDSLPKLNNHSTFSITIKDDGAVWTITTAWKFPEGPVTDVSTLEKGTLILRKEAFGHFLHKDQPWKPVAINLDFTTNKVTGAMKYATGPDKPVSVDLSGPVFAYAPGPELTIGFLPLTEGYEATLRCFDIERLAVKPQAPDKEKLLQLKVVGKERITVPAGTFDSVKVELTPTGGGSDKETVWIAKDSHMPVKTYVVEVLKNGTTATTIVEMVL